MENKPRSRARMLYLPVLAVGVALVAAVSSWAANPAGSSSPAQSTAPATQQIQDSETTPAPPSGEGRAEDCPKHRGGGRGRGDGGPRGAAPQSAPQSASPPATQSDTEV